MSDSMRTEAELRLNVTSNIGKAVQELGRYNEATGFTNRETQQLERTLVKAQEKFEGISRTARAGSQTVKQYADGFDKLVSELNRFTAAQRQAAQANAVGGGNGGLNLAGMSDSRLNALGATINAQRANPEAAVLAEIQRRADAASGSVAGLTSTAYSLMNISFTLGVVSGGFLAADVAAIKTAADFEAAFAQVERTAEISGTAAASLKAQLIGLSTTIPVSFESISQIAALGGQLGIVAGDLTNFTRATAEFSATSNVGTDAAGTALGRLGQLLPDVEGQYENLASSILKVGVNSVATESQIIAIAQNIVGIGTSAGMTTPDIIGLSGALASLGVQPELARGTVTRLITQIQTAASAGGQALDNFGAVAGTSGAEFKAAWESSPSNAIVQLMAGLSEQGPDAAAALAQLGITSTRDVPTLLKLAQNTDVLTQALSDAGAGFQDSSTLQEQYGHIAETLNAKLGVLANTWQALVATVGGSSVGPLGEAVDLLTGLLKAADAVAKNPVGQWAAGAGLALTGLVGATGAVAAAMALATGNALLFKSALASEAISANTATVATRAFKIAAIGTGVGAAVVGVATLAAFVLEAAGAFDTAAEKSEKFLGSSEGLAAGFRKDAANYQVTGEAIRKIHVEQDTASASASSWSGSVDQASAAQSGLESSVRSTSDAIGQQTLVYGQNAKAALASMLQSSEQYQALFKNKGLQANLTLAGGSVQGFTEAILGDPENGAENYIRRLKAALEAKRDEIGASGSSAMLSGQSTAFEALQAAADSVAGSIDAASTANAAFAATTGNAASAMGQLDSETMDASGSTMLLRDQINSQIETIYSGVNAQYELAQSTGALGEAFVNNGAAAAVNGQELQTVISNILAASATTGEAANNLQGFFNALVQGGYASAEQLTLLQQVISQLGGSKNATAFNMQPFVAGMSNARQAMKKTSSAAKQTKAEIRTLVDYANDLSSVFKRAFDIRFGGEQELDKISSGWESIRKSAAEAEDEMRAANATLQELASDRKIDQYWLSVAKLYGDTLRAAKIQADLAKNSQDTASAQKDLANAQTKASKSLDGNSDAAIANRETLLGLVGNYQEYITSLASSGMSQDQLRAKTSQLKQDFIAQATQMGFSRDAVMRYATSFDDMTLAINRVPRNITVSSNTNPAMQALNELQAKLRDTTNNGAGYNIPITSSYDPAAAAKAARGSQLQAQLSGIQAQYEKAVKSGSDNVASRLLDQINALSGRINAGNYWTGGYTGAGGKYDWAGNVHKGEFVFDNVATRNAGPGNLAKAQDAFRSGKPFSYNGGAAAGRGTSGPIDLSAASISALADALAARPTVFSGPRLAQVAALSNVNSTNRGVS